MAYVSRDLRERVTRRANSLCEYCKTAQAIVIEMEIDHIVPESAGGLTEELNLCLACISCNHFKHDFQTGLDPETSQTVQLFNPRTQIWNEHFAWNEQKTHVIGLTPVGRATVERMNMNRDLIVKARQRWVQAGWHPPV